MLKHALEPWPATLLCCPYCLQDLMKGAADVTNVVTACTVEGRQERLEAMLQQLELCEKALQVKAAGWAACRREHKVGRDGGC